MLSLPSVVYFALMMLTSRGPVRGSLDHLFDLCQEITINWPRKRFPVLVRGCTDGTLGLLHPIAC